MAKAFSVASWNVEHFKGEKDRKVRVVQFLKDQNADVFALYEVEGKEVFELLVNEMPNYQFHITEGPQVQEILLGVKRNHTAFFTQRTEFKRGNTYLRPGALLSLQVNSKVYSLLFLHTKSSDEPIGLGIRDEQFKRALKFKKTLDDAAGGQGKANYIFLGDLNTMGMYYPYQKSVEAVFEVRRLENKAKRRNMRILNKSMPYNWWNGPEGAYPQSNLDHVVASDHLAFKVFNGADVDVRGWPMLQDDHEASNWIEQYSDHGLLYFEVQDA